MDGARRRGHIALPFGAQPFTAYLLLAFALIGLFIAAEPLARDGSPSARRVAQLSICLPPVHSSEPPKDGQSLEQGKHVRAIQQPHGTPKAIALAHPLSYHVQPLFLSSDPLVTKFTKGVYHRYRPRDPTPA